VAESIVRNKQGDRGVALRYKKSGANAEVLHNG
jgi:hypothetical protein